MKKIIFIVPFLFIFHLSFSQTWLWGKCGIGWGYGVSVATDKMGNDYLSGNYIGEDTLNFSDSILVNPPHDPYGSSIFVVKYNNIGNIQWARQSINYGNLDFSQAGFLASDNACNVYVAASYTDTVIIGDDTIIFLSSTKTADCLLAKYSPTGNLLWASSPILNNNDSSGINPNRISTDSYSNVFVAGIFNADTVYFGSLYMLGNRHCPYAFLVKYDSTGNVLWANASFGHIYLYNSAEGDGIANDLGGNAYLAGTFSDSIWLGSYQLLTSPYSVDEFLVKYSPNGTVRWAKQAALASGKSSCRSVADVCDKDGNIYVAGDFDDTITFGSITLIGGNILPNPQSNIFLAKYDSNGTVLWAKEGKDLDGNAWGVGGMSIDNYNHIYLSGGGGTGHCKIAFGSDTISINDTARHDAASIIVKFDSNGNVLCSTIIQGGGAYYPNSISSDTSGKYVYFGGTTGTILPFGNDTIKPFSYPTPPFYNANIFPFTARLGECFETATETPVITKDVEFVKVYPNPNNGRFTVSLLNVNQRCNIEIYNILGKKVCEETLPQTLNCSINLSGQPNGIYLYRVLSENGGLVGEGKVIVQK